MTEDLSKRTRESRQELRKFMRNIKKRNPERHCLLEYDKLFVDHSVFVWNDIEGQVGRGTALCTKQSFGELSLVRTTNVTGGCLFLENAEETLWVTPSALQVVELSETERQLDPAGLRSASALGRGRPGLSRGLSMPNIAGQVDSEAEILERIRDLELQIANQQVNPHIFSEPHNSDYVMGRRQSRHSKSRS